MSHYLNKLLNCCSSPDFDGSMCQCCFTKWENRSEFWHKPMFEFKRDDSEDRYFPRYGGYYLPIAIPEMKGVIFSVTTGFESPVDGIGHRLWAAFGRLKVMLKSCFVG